MKIKDFGKNNYKKYILAIDWEYTKECGWLFFDTSDNKKDFEYILTSNYPYPFVIVETDNVTINA